MFGEFDKGLDNGYQVQTAWACYPAGAMIQIVTEVKSRLLEFLLELSEKFPEEVDPNNIKIRSKEVNVSEIFKNTMFGDNATVIATVIFGKGLQYDHDLANSPSKNTGSYCATQGIQIEKPLNFDPILCG